MLTGPALERLAAAIVRACRSGLDADALRAAVLPRLREAVPIDALWWAAADPATLLFTQSYREELPEESGRYFVENEFLRRDVNKWTELARDPVGVRTLMEMTSGDPASSERYRDIFAPLGLQDELRAVLRMRDVCWGYICLHREAAQATFSPSERTWAAGRTARISRSRSRCWQPGSVIWMQRPQRCRGCGYARERGGGPPCTPPG
jgi:hypothetical protein